jgi:hypothetical protein
MNIIHTSPVKIDKITPWGLFDDCLFFSADEYVMTQSDEYFVYSLNIDDDQIISVSSLYDDEIIADIVRVLDVSENDAEQLLNGSCSVYDLGCDGEYDWWIQAKQGECGKKMGYEAVKSIDEQGTVFIVPMLGRENDLILEAVKKG